MGGGDTVKRRLRIRTIVGLLTLLMSVNVAGVVLFASVRLLPAARDVRQTTEPLLQLFERLGEGQRWLAEALGEAGTMTRTRSPEARGRLKAMLAERDHLVGTLPLAVVPQRVRVPLARAEEAMSRLVVLLDEMVTLDEMGRNEEALDRMAEAGSLRTRVVGIIAEAELAGLADVIQGQQRLEFLNRQFIAICIAWLIVTTGIVLGGLKVVRGRFAEHLGDLQDGLARVGRGDLSVEIVPRAADELRALTEHFNSMTRVLRDRAERQGQVAAAGELLAGVAHEVNNPLMAIVATAEMRLSDPNLAPGVRVDLENLIGEAQRAGQLVKGIVKLIRPDTGAPRATDFNEVIRDAWDLVWFQFRADGVKGRLQLAEGMRAVNVNPQKLQQVFVNLLSNAHHAVVGGNSAREIRVRSWSERGRVCAEVVDTGSGVPSEAVPKLFAPFFSTRTDGRVGLGLYTSRLIAREAGGDVEYRSGERGACFMVWLPALPEGVAAAREAPSGEYPVLVGTRPSSEALRSPVPAPRGRGPLAGRLVLVVDDEAMVRRPIARFLGKCGSRVVEAADGHEALASIRVEQPDLVLTDVRMPGMDGVALYREIAARFPALAARVYFLSGDVAALEQLGDDHVASARVLRKPIELGELERRLSDGL
jgi:signal transduction histidine kinase